MDPEPVKHPIRIAVIGLGPRAINNVIRAVTTYREYRLVAVCDILPAIVKQVTADLNKKQVRVAVHGLAKDAGSEDLDAVAVQVDPDKQVAICCGRWRRACT